MGVTLRRSYGKDVCLRLWTWWGKAATVLSLDRLAEFVAVMWECWHSRNRFLFGKKDGWRGRLTHRAITFVHNFIAVKETNQGCLSKGFNKYGNHQVRGS